MLPAGSRVALSVYTIICAQKTRGLNGRPYRQVWKERAFAITDSHFACLEIFFCENRNAVTVLRWSLNSVTSQFKPVNKLGFFFFKIMFYANNISIRASPVWSSSSKHYVPRPHPSFPQWFDYPDTIRWRAQIVKLLIIQISPSSVSYPPLGIIFSMASFPQTVSLCIIPLLPPDVGCTSHKIHP